jgi:hypothetical protein
MGIELEMSEVAQETSERCEVDVAMSDTRCAMCEGKSDVRAWSRRVERRILSARCAGECEGMSEESAECSQCEIEGTGTVRDVERC